jgi:site-specific DNA-methyltransferase (adenine-specific)
MGLDEFEDKVIEGRDPGQDDRSVAYKKRPTPTKNTHPTVKPVALMTYLCRLITPPNGIVLDPFMGSGSTGISALLEGFRFCGMEQDKSYFDIASARIENYDEYKKFIKK